MTRLKGATAFLLALIWLQAPAVGVSGEPRKGHRPKEPIAVLLDLEGAQASLGRPAMNGFVLGLQHATEDEPTLFTALVDTKTDAKITEANAKTLARSVSMAAGFTDNDSVLIGGPYFQRARVPFLSIGATDPALPEEVGESVFLTPFGDNTQAAAAAEFARRELGSTVAILWDATSNYTRALPRYFRTRFEELGGFVLLDASFDGGCDLSQLGNQVVGLASSPVFIYLAGLPDCIGEVVASLRAAGVAQPILGGDGFDTPNLLEVDSGATTNVWFTTHAWLSEETGSPEAQAFIAAYRDAFGASPPNAFAALG